MPRSIPLSKPVETGLKRGWLDRKRGGIQPGLSVDDAGEIMRWPLRLEECLNDVNDLILSVEHGQCAPFVEG